MNTAKTWQTSSLSSEDTLKIGEQLGQRCKGGELFVLVSDLGGGKTTFVKGLAKGMGSVENIGSPTFTINRVYTCANDLVLQHFDFYRLQEPGIIANELAEVITEPDTVIAVEWGDIVTDVLPDNRIEITISRVAEGEELRKFSVSYPEQFTYLFEDKS